MKTILFLLILCWLNTIFYPSAASLLTLRNDIKTRLIKEVRQENQNLNVPQSIFKIVKYPTPIGEMTAYISQPKENKQRYPAIIWISGGFPVGGISSSAWTEQPKSNDQSAKAYRKAGIITMYPTLRGTHGNPGFQEGFYGEVNDIISALNFLKQQSYVDPKAIYLGGHSTGGTLALLVAASTDEFKAIFAFGPVTSPAGYGRQYIFYNPEVLYEKHLRSPIYFLSYIETPTFIIEGQNGNTLDLKLLKLANQNENITFITISGGNHFDILFSSNQFIASKFIKKKSKELSQNDLQDAYDMNFKPEKNKN
ncbi:MAG: prolyl oligopeptidase family serine peptidase [Pseudomonadota bacterium]